MELFWVPRVPHKLSHLELLPCSADQASWLFTVSRTMLAASLSCIRAQTCGRSPASRAPWTAGSRHKRRGLLTWAQEHGGPLRLRACCAAALRSSHSSHSCCRRRARDVDEVTGKVPAMWRDLGVLGRAGFPQPTGTSGLRRHPAPHPESGEAGGYK